MVAGARVREGVTANEHRISAWDHENVPELDCGDGCRTHCILQCKTVRFGAGGVARW